MQQVIKYQNQYRSAKKTSVNKISFAVMHAESVANAGSNDILKVLVVPKLWANFLACRPVQSVYDWMS